MDVKQFGMKNLNRGRLLNGQMQKTMEKLASGFRINRAADDAAGLAVSEKLRVELSEQQQCVQNVRHGTNLACTADAALQEVNDMMKRAETLCLQAKNGTFSELERQELTDELNALYDEMERIFDSAEFADTKLFQYDSPDEIGDYPKKIKELVEHAAPLPRGVYAQWGDLGVVPHQTFDKAVPAKPATAALQLRSNLDLNDAMSLSGKGFYIKSPDHTSEYDVYVTFSESGSGPNFRKHTDGRYYYEYDIAAKNVDVQTALDRLCEKMKSNNIFAKEDVLIEQATVDDSGLVTFSFKRSELVEPPYTNFPVEEGDGTTSNNVSIETKEIAAVNPINSISNYYDSVGTKTLDFLGDAAYDDTIGQQAEPERSRLINALKNNTLHVGDIKISFAALNVDGTTKVGTIRDEMIRQIADAQHPDISAAYADAEKKTIILTKNNCSTGSSDSLSVTEDVRDADSVATNKPAVNTLRYEAATRESAEVLEFSLQPLDFPLTLKINNENHTFYQYDAGRSSYTVSDGQAHATFSSTPSGLLGEIASKIRSVYGTDKVDCTVDNGVFKLHAKRAGEELGFSIASASGNVALNYKQKDLQIEVGSFKQDHVVEIELGSDVTKLAGTGFILNSTIYEFANGTEGRDQDATVVDVNGVADINVAAESLRAAIDADLDQNYTVSVSGSAIRIVSNYTLSYTNGKTGVVGLFENNTPDGVMVMPSGGTVVSKPGTTIDFSKYNAENFHELYGTGFRVTCATCKGEFINVMFCYDKAQAAFPPYFDYVDENGDPIKDENGNPYVDEDGKPLKIWNCAVELKNMSSGSDIVKNIVDQLSAELKHYTGLDIGTPDSVLMVHDRRPGDQPDYNNPGEIQQAEIIPGVYTNCTYSKTILRHPNPETYIGGPDGSTTAYYGYCSVYAGDTEGKPDWIYVHLPNLSLNMLNLDPPRPDLTQVDTIDDVCSRLKIADNLISTARGQLGADQNRLDHAKMNLTVSAEQTADAYSRIRDLDMAEGMTEQVKLSILQQTQQSALAHIHQQGSEILKLMQ